MEELRERAQEVKIAETNRHPFYHLHRRLSWRFTKLAYRLGIGANLLTLAMIITWVFGVAIALTDFASLAPAIFYLSFILDKSDGELARISGMESRIATYADEIFHFFSIPAVLAAIVVPRGSETDFIWMSAACVAYFLLKYERKLHYKFNTRLSRKVSTVPEWFVQDDVMIFILAISLWTQLFNFLFVWAILLAVAALWRVTSSLFSDGFSVASKK